MIDDAGALARLIPSREHWRLFAAFADIQSVVRLWSDTSAAAVRRAAEVPADRCLATQGHVLTAADFVSTLVVEAALHHLDLVVDVPGAPAPAASVLSHVRSVFDAMLGQPAPSDWDDVDYLLAAGGRVAVPADVPEQSAAPASATSRTR